MTDKLPYIPEESGYSVDHADEVVSVALKGGLSRQRADVSGNTHFVRATWLLDREDVLNFVNFMVTKTQRGALPFLADLAIDFWAPTQYKCLMVPKSMKTQRVEGHSYRISMELEAEQVQSFVAAERFETTNQVFFTGTPSPLDFQELFVVGDKIQIVGAALNNGVNPAINLDGIYTVATVPTPSRVTLSSPASINPDWSLLASYPGGITPLISNVALINVPA